MALIRNSGAYTPPGGEVAPWDAVDGVQFQIPVADREGNLRLVPGVYVIPEAPGEVFPTIYWCRGGLDGDSSLKDAHLTAIADLCDNNEGLDALVHGAPDGYCAMAVDYFGGASAWNGRTFPAAGDDELGGDDLRSVLAMPAAMQTVQKANTSRAAIVGASRGGMMAGLAMMRGFPARACVLINPLASISDDHYRADADIEALLRDNVPGYGSSSGAHLQRRDVLANVDRLPLAPRYLIVQGMRDTTVQPEKSERLAWEINRRGGDAQFAPVEDANHQFVGSSSEDYGVERDALVVKFLADTLGEPPVTTVATGVGGP